VARLFGTDGVRGVANRDLTPELTFYLGRAAGALLRRRAERPRLLIGRDTRASGDMLEAALIAGATSAGVDCAVAGVIPTPGVAYVTKRESFDAGVMISASHNPVEDNGIKFFSSDGFKLTDDEEAEIEAEVRRLQAGEDSLPRPTAGAVGTRRETAGGAQAYAAFLKEAFDLDLSGKKIVVDCANGAASAFAPGILESLGAEVIALYVEPTGVNINVGCGSTHPERAQSAVVEHGAWAGLAFDGDADRVIAVDERGELVNGDHILAILGLDMLRRGALPRRALAATVYSNLGLKLALEKEGGTVVETAAGDRYVLEAMLKEGLILGGEQSGHVILLEHNTTGDGILTGLALLATAIRCGANLSELKQAMTPLPQVLVNVRVADKSRLKECRAVADAVRAGEERLKGRGRILVRASGTEPVVRVMGEGESMDEVQSIVGEIAAVIGRELG